MYSLNIHNIVVRRDILLGGFARIFISESEASDMKEKII